jgi:hypothetical protein
MSTLALICVLTSRLRAMVTAVVLSALGDRDSGDYLAFTLWMSALILIHDFVSFPKVVKTHPFKTLMVSGTTDGR